MTENPKDSLYYTIANDPRDWAKCKRDAWIYGIIVGWDEESLQQIKEQHKWSQRDADRLSLLHEKFELLEEWLPE